MRNLEECRQLPALADTVWAERTLVERLLYKLVTAKLILAADLRRYVPQALEEVEDIVGQLWAAEDRRVIALGAVATEWRVRPDELTLGHLAEEAPEPWSSMFADHHQAFAEMTSEIEQTAADNRRLANTALASIQTSLGNLTGVQPSTYTAQGAAASGPVRPTTIDQAM